MQEEKILVKFGLMEILVTETQAAQLLVIAAGAREVDYGYPSAGNRVDFYTGKPVRFELMDTDVSKIVTRAQYLEMCKEAGTDE